MMDKDKKEKLEAFLKELLGEEGKVVEVSGNAAREALEELLGVGGKIRSERSFFSEQNVILGDVEYMRFKAAQKANAEMYMMIRKLALVFEALVFNHLNSCMRGDAKNATESSEQTLDAFNNLLCKTATKLIKKITANAVKEDEEECDKDCKHD